MSHYGIIYCGYQCADLLPASLNPWIEARKARLGGHTFTICAVSAPFVGFDHGGEERDRTRTLLGFALTDGQIDHAIVSDKPMKETEARGAALKWLVERGVHATIQIDADETWSQDQITAALGFVEANPWVQWFRVCYKQLVFTPHQWLAEPFTPPRIHRVRVHEGLMADGFWDDNNVRYSRPFHTGDIVKRDIQMASMTIPQGLVWVPHATWLNDSRSRAKARYQQARWAPPVGAGCSFAWDDERGGLVWNEAYFALTGQPIPEVLHD